jgi:hypothetical protein
MKIAELIGLYGLQCSETKELAPTMELSEEIKRIATLESEVAAMREQRDQAEKEIGHFLAELATLRAEVEGMREDAERWRWLRQQHEGHDEFGALDAEGFPLPAEPTACAFTVFMPDKTGAESLVPVVCIPGELDDIIDAARKESSNG